jgi:hypothetical protein
VAEADVEVLDAESTGSAGRLQILHCPWNGEAGCAERAVHLMAREQPRDPAPVASRDSLACDAVVTA